MKEVIRKNLALLTLVAVLTGALLAMSIQQKVSHSEPWSQTEFLREIDLGTDMPVLAVSLAVTSRFAKRPLSTDDLTQPLLVDDKARTRLFIPDKYAKSAIGCNTHEPEFARINSEYGGTWFEGTLAGKPRVSRTVKSPEGQNGIVSFEGSVFMCQEGKRVPLASGVQLQVPVQQVHPQGVLVRSSTGWAAYPGFVADFYISFLLMIFVPTLTLSVIKAIVDSAQTVSGTGKLFRYSLLYFALSTTLASIIGIFAGYFCYRTGMSGSNLTQIAAATLSANITPAEYDPHPILTQLANVVPLNPLGALTNPDGNKGLQVAFTAILIGVLLAVIGPERQKRVSGFLKHALALIVRDNDLKWESLSDWADLFTPFGVFFVSLTFCATLSFDFLAQILNVVLIILAALAVHAAVLLIWIFSKRDWHSWFRDGLIPGATGLMTALATSSSYAALPAITAVPLLSKDSGRRGVFDISTTLNKNGTTIYIATFAAYILFDKLEGAMHPLVIVVLLLSSLASVATAGLPFAAVFGLRMVLLATSLPAGLAWVIVPIDPLVDRFVTVVNVFSNLVASSGAKRVVGEELPSSGTCSSNSELLDSFSEALSSQNER